jgi:hypothetical protein
VLCLIFLLVGVALRNLARDLFLRKKLFRVRIHPISKLSLSLIKQPHTASQSIFLNQSMSLPDWDPLFESESGRSSNVFSSYLSAHSRLLPQQLQTIRQIVSSFPTMKGMSGFDVFLLCLQDRSFIHFSVKQLKELKPLLSSFLNVRLVGTTKFDLVKNLNAGVFFEPNKTVKSRFLSDFASMQSACVEINKTLKEINKKLKKPKVSSENVILKAAAKKTVAKKIPKKRVHVDTDESSESDEQPKKKIVKKVCLIS